MKKLLFILLCLTVSISGYAQKIKVACVGNSITYGSRVENREQNSYPAQLPKLLGDEYEVKNFGVSATTALYKDAEMKEAVTEIPAELKAVSAPVAESGINAELPFDLDDSKLIGFQFAK